MTMARRTLREPSMIAINNQTGSHRPGGQDRQHEVQRVIGARRLPHDGGRCGREQFDPPTHRRAAGEFALKDQRALVGGQQALRPRQVSGGSGIRFRG